MLVDISMSLHLASRRAQKMLKHFEDLLTTLTNFDEIVPQREIE